MQKLMLVLLILLFLVVEMRCSRGTRPFRAHFFTSNQQHGPLYLYIDGKNKGLLPYQSVAPACGSDSLEQQTLYVLLPSGKYRVEAKDKDRHVAISEELVLKLDASNLIISNNFDNNRGSGKTTFKDDCIVNELF